MDAQSKRKENYWFLWFVYIQKNLSFFDSLMLKEQQNIFVKVTATSHSNLIRDFFLIRVTFQKKKL